MESKDKLLKTGTTTVAIKCKDGVVMAADKRASAGYMVANKHEKKVVPIHDNIVITTAGLVSDLQLLTKIIKAQLKLTEIRNGKEVSVKKAANILAGLVYSNIRKMSMFQSIVGFLMGGKDSEGFHVYNIGVDGSLGEVRDYSCDGSGMMFATGVLEAEYKEGISIEEGIKLAVKVINTAIKRDLATGNGINVYTITAEGARHVMEKEINNSLEA